MLLNDNDSGNLSYGLSFCISNKLSGDVHATNTRTTLYVARFNQNDVYIIPFKHVVLGDIYV